VAADTHGNGMHEIVGKNEVWGLGNVEAFYLLIGVCLCGANLEIADEFIALYFVKLVGYSAEQNYCLQTSRLLERGISPLLSVVGSLLSLREIHFWSLSTSTVTNLNLSFLFRIQNLANFRCRGASL
jgi:hypothetical protein